MFTGCRSTAAAVACPPFDFMIVQGRGGPSCFKLARTLATWRIRMGLINASTTVVELRSYSRQMGATSCEIDSGIVGNLDPRYFYTASSC